MGFCAPFEVIFLKSKFPLVSIWGLQFELQEIHDKETFQYFLLYFGYILRRNWHYFWPNIWPNIRPKISANAAEYSVSAETGFSRFGRTLDKMVFDQSLVVCAICFTLSLGFECHMT